MTGDDFEARLAAFKSKEFSDLRTAQAHVLDAYATEHAATRDLAIELPTGVGKTLIALLIADAALDEGKSVAYLTGTRQLAEQVEDHARRLGFDLHHLWGGHYPPSELHDYHDAQVAAVMNYWVYFNTRPVPQPADLVIFDDAHVAEQPLASLFSLRISRRDWTDLYQGICDLILAHSNAYSSLQAMRDGAAPVFTPPELLTFNDWTGIIAGSRDLIGSSAFSQEEAAFVWPVLRGNLERCGVLVGPSAIEIRPYHPPTRILPHYAEARQRIYLSATLGTMDDLQRRLGTDVVTSMGVPPEFRREQTGTRMFLLNPATDHQLSDSVLSFALAQARRTPRTAWLCASYIEADEIAEYLRDEDEIIYRLRPRDDSAFDQWLSAPKGHLVAAGRFDGLDFPGDVCRLVVVPTVPAASTEFERFAVAYLGDAMFMRHRIGQRVTQALGRANRELDDRAMYIALDPGFGVVLADPAVNASLAEEVRPVVRNAFDTHSTGWKGTLAAAELFWSGGQLVETTTQRKRPGRKGMSGGYGSADSEVGASTALWLGDFPKAASQALDAASRLETAGEVEHAAFWRYVSAHALWLGGREQDMAAARSAIDNAISAGPRTAWFVKLRRTLDEIDGSRIERGTHDALFHSWEEWIRERGGRVSGDVNEARRLLLSGSHDEKVVALGTLARLCGAVADRPSEQSATDSRWRWVTPSRTECRVWDVKTGTAADQLPRKDVNQVLGQITVESRRSAGTRVFGCLLTAHETVAPDAAAAAHDKIGILHQESAIRLLNLLGDKFSLYLQLRAGGTAQERGHARSEVEGRLPRGDWLSRVLSPSHGKVRSANGVEDLFLKGISL